MASVFQLEIPTSVIVFLDMMDRTAKTSLVSALHLGLHLEISLIFFKRRFKVHFNNRKIIHS
jgi:hypothetical protein